MCKDWSLLHISVLTTPSNVIDGTIVQSWMEYNLNDRELFNSGLFAKDEELLYEIFDEQFSVHCDNCSPSWILISDGSVIRA